MTKKKKVELIAEAIINGERKFKGEKVELTDEQVEFYKKAQAIK